MAKMTVETHPGSGLPHKDHLSPRERLESIRSWATTAVLVVGILAVSGVGAWEVKQLVDGGRDNLATKIVSVAPAGDTPKVATPQVTSTPEATPTEVPMTAQEKVAAATQAQQTALAEGKVKIPAPEDFIAAGGKIEQSRVYTGGVINLFFIAPPEKGDIVVPALVGGKVIEAGRMNAGTNDILIQVGNQELIIAFPYGDGEFLVKKGQEVSLDTPAFIVHYDPTSPNQKKFEAGGSDTPPGTVAILGIQDLTAGQGKGFGQVTKDSILKNAQGVTMTVPSSISSK